MCVILLISYKSISSLQNNLVPSLFSSFRNYLLKIRIRHNLHFIGGLILALSLLTCCSQDPLKTALETDDCDKGYDAVQKLNDQALLVKVYWEANEICVKRYALDKITDPNILTEIILKSKNATKDMETSLLSVEYLQSVIYDDCKEALDKINDQPLLAKIAIESDIWSDNGEAYDINMLALDKISDQMQLARIYMADVPISVRWKIENKITDYKVLRKMYIDGGINPYETRRFVAYRLKNEQPLFEKLSLEKENIPMRSLYKLISLCETEKVYDAGFFFDSMLNAVIILSDREVVNMYGEIVSINVEWSQEDQEYRELGSSRTSTFYEDSYWYSIQLKKMPKPITGSWKDELPGTIMSIGGTITRQSTPIDINDFLKPIFGQGNIPKKFDLDY